MGFVKTSIKIDINDAQVQALLLKQDGPVWGPVSRAGRAARNYAVLELRNAQIGNTGKLAQSIEARTEIRERLVVSRIGTTMPYAIFVHEGTRSPIVPTTRKVLRFRGAGGAYVFRPQVRGTLETGKYVPFLRKAIERISFLDFL
jgi:hypothetical protein